MPSIGPISFATFAGNDNGNGDGSVDWTNAGNAAASDNSYATVAVTVPSPQVSRFLRASNGDFSALPNGSTIDGVLIEWELKGDVSGADINHHGLYLGGVYRSFVSPISGSIGTSDGIVSIGGPTSKGGSPSELTAANVKASTFGPALSVYKVSGAGTINVSCDHVRVTVYYTPPAAFYHGRPHGQSGYRQMAQLLAT